MPHAMRKETGGLWALNTLSLSQVAVIAGTEEEDTATIDSTQTVGCI